MVQPISTRRRSLRFQHLEARCLLDASALRISEFMASNEDTLVDYQGDSSDWLEIYNPTAAAVDLTGLYLTDDDAELTKWQFPAGSSIAAGGFLVVFASDKDVVAAGGELHTNFRLSADGEYLGLVAADGLTVIDQYAPEFPPQVEDVSYGREMTGSPVTLVAEGAPAKAWVPTNASWDATWTSPAFDDSGFNITGPTGFGYENSPGSFPSFVGEYSTPVSSGTAGLYVRVPFEVSSLSGLGQLKLNMKYDDGFVAYLNGVEIASANAPASPNWSSTATTFHDDFEAISFTEFDVADALPLLVEGDNVLAIHALNFSAGSSDFLIVPELTASESEIASPETIGYLNEPTPGYGNGEAFAGFVEQPTFSVPHGFYNSTQQVSIATATPGALIVYTTDGSTPAVDENLTPINGQAYSTPVTVSSTTPLRAIAFRQDYKPSFVQASSYLFLDDIVEQSPAGEAPAGWPGFNVNGQVLDYGIDPQIVSQYGEQAVKDSLASLPAIALTTDVENLFDATTGIYVNAGNRGREWERFTSVELINPDMTGGFTTNAGLRIRGGASRNNGNPKHAFRLYFRSEYGDGLLNYPLFGEEGADKFDVLDLRTSQNYSWASWGDSINGAQNSFLREVFSRDTQADLGDPHTRSDYFHLYLNGQYWGLFMTQERVQEHFGESYFGGDQEDYDVVKSDPFESGGTEIADGTDVAWRQLFESAQALADNPTGAANNYWAMQGLNPDGTRNESLPVLLDVDNLINYMMIIFYTGGHDTGISAFFGNERANNWFGIRNRETGDEGFQFFLHDNEHSLGAGELTGTLHGTFTIDRTGPFSGQYYDDFEFFNPAFLHQDLLAHPEYVQRFVDRATDLLLNNGPLTADANIARMSERVAEVESAIIANAARWGDAERSVPYDKSDWDAEVNWLLNTYFPQRGDMVIAQLQNDGLLSPLGVPEFSQLGGEVDAGYPLELSSAGGTIYYSLDGATDPREIGGGVNPAAAVQAYTGPIVLTADTTVWARVREPSGAWSGLVKADFSVLQLPGDYDKNGLIDVADYNIWKSTYGSTSDLRADGNEDGIVDAADFTVWGDSFAQQPTVVTAAAASPTTVTGVSTDLSVLGGVLTGEQNLAYTWSATGPGSVSYSVNGTNAAKSTTATFTEAGEYTFTVAIENTAFDAVAFSSVAVTVTATVSGVAIEPTAGVVAAGASLQLAAFEADQFGNSTGVPTSVTWSVGSGGGSVTAGGLYTAPATGDMATVLAQGAAGQGSTVVDIVTPRAWYEADESFGTTLNDSSGNGNNATLSGTTGWTTGVDGNALSLSGGRANLPNNITGGLDDFTIATWFYLDSKGAWSRVFDFGSGTAANMFLTPAAGSTTGPLRFAITTSGGGGEQQLNGPTLSTGQWYHVAITQAGNLGTMYLNGSPVATNNGMTLSPADLGFTFQNWLGDSQYGADPALFGRIDEFRIYPEALPSEQIEQLSNLAFSTVSIAQTVTASAVSEPASVELLSVYSTGGALDLLTAPAVTATFAPDASATSAIRESAFAALGEGGIAKPRRQHAPARRDALPLRRHGRKFTDAEPLDELTQDVSHRAVDRALGRGADGLRRGPLGWGADDTA